MTVGVDILLRTLRKRKQLEKDPSRRNSYIPCSQKYWWELNLAVESQIAMTNILARFKFGGSVQYRHTYICEEEILADF